MYARRIAYISYMFCARGISLASDAIIIIFLRDIFVFVIVSHSAVLCPPCACTLLSLRIASGSGALFLCIHPPTYILSACNILQSF